MSRPRIVCLLLTLITLLVYLPVLRHGFVNYDDGAYVEQNQLVQAGLTWTGVKWAFTTFYSCNWHPLTWLSHMFDCELFGLNAGWHHLINVLIHSVNAVLVFSLFLRLTGAFWSSALIAALFAWHPLRVESVAWVAERKDVLCAFFGILAMTAYVRYAQKQAQGKPVRADYGLALLCFALGLMAKPMLVTLPFVFLLLDYWPLQRVPTFGSRVSGWFRLALEKWPFFVLTIGSCLITLIAQHRGESVLSVKLCPLPLRFENAVVSCVNYLLKTVWPADLAVIYPLPKQIPWVHIAIAATFLMVISWLIWRARVSRPYLLTGWLWYLGMLVPVIGLVQVGFQAMADRYTYLPQIGVFVVVIFGIGDLTAKLRLKPTFLIPVTSLILAGCLIATARQLRVWRTGEALFAHAVAVTKENVVALNNLGVVLDLRGQPEKAMEHYREALRLEPNYALAHNNLALVLVQTGRTLEAIQHFQETLRLQPDYPETHFNLGLVLFEKGQIDVAAVHFQRALEIRPDFEDACQKLCHAAWILATSPDASLRNGAKAAELVQQADRLSGGTNALIVGTLAATYAEAGRFAEALEAAQRALQLATAQDNASQVNALIKQIEIYQVGLPFRDYSITNRHSLRSQP